MEHNAQALEKAMRLARSAQGQQLLSMLQNKHNDVLTDAMQYASSGDYSKAQQALSRLLSDPEAQNLLRQLGDNHG